MMNELVRQIMEYAEQHYGVEPDYPIEDAKKMYDRAWLTDYIKSLK